MSVHPIFAHMFADMGRIGLLPELDLRQIPVNEATKPSESELARVQHAVDLHKARMRREARKARPVDADGPEAA